MSSIHTRRGFKPSRGELADSPDLKPMRAVTARPQTQSGIVAQFNRHSCRRPRSARRPVYMSFFLHGYASIGDFEL